MKNTEKQFGYLVAMTVLLFAGLGFVGWGSAISDDYKILSPIVLSFGGTFFGAAVTMTLGLFRQINLLELLKTSLEATFRSSNEEISNFRRTLHQYHLTETKDGWCWRYVVMDFSHSEEAGSLNCRVMHIDDNKNPYPTSAEAGIRRGRFITLQHPDSGEPTVVSVFPYMGKGVLPHHCGIAIFETWLDNPIVSRAILGADPVLDWIEPGSVPKEVAEECDKIWETYFKSDISPLTNGFNAKTTKNESGIDY
jgi:hypothetical protein